MKVIYQQNQPEERNHMTKYAAQWTTPEDGVQLFQGECVGLVFWHPLSQLPEQGVFLFDNPLQVQQLAREMNKAQSHFHFVLEAVEWTGPVDDDGQYGLLLDLNEYHDEEG